MTAKEFRARLQKLAGKADLSIPANQFDQLEAYFQLLSLWNKTINLTSLPLAKPTDLALEILLVEPIAAAQHVRDSSRLWFDVGSGGGSPAIPMKIARPGVRLIMIESRQRKAAFLREAIRALNLLETDVENGRLDEIVGRTELGTVDLATVRAVRRDESVIRDLRRVLSPSGKLFVFDSNRPAASSLSGFSVDQVVEVGRARDSRLTILSPMFHVEQSR